MRRGWCELCVSSIHTSVHNLEGGEMGIDLRWPLATSSFVNSRFFRTQAHVPQKGGKEGEKRRERRCSCEVTPHAESRGKCQWEKGIEWGEGGKGRREREKGKKGREKGKKGRKKEKEILVDLGACVPRARTCEQKGEALMRSKAAARPTRFL